MSITQEIKDRLDIVEVVGEYVPLRRTGRNYAGFCPFHHNTKTPAFFVSADKQTWRCFGACADGGDIFSFVMKKEGWDFPEALKNLAQRAGVELPTYQKEIAEDELVEDRLNKLLQEAAAYFHHLLLYAPQAEGARRYVQGRDLSAETIAQFQLGYALESWDACKNHFMGQGYSQEELVEGGLLTENVEKKSHYDRFRHRLIFPISDHNGRVVGFGARTLEKDGIPKYLNSPQTTLFDKSKLLYGLHLAKRAIRDQRQGVIVEGYMDVIRAHQAGYSNVVAQMGTALTESQLTLLKRYTKRFVIALDADEAGVNATLRSLQVARETLDHTEENAFNPTGLIRQESRLNADIRVATIPLGKDPDDLIRADAGRWPRLLEEALPVVAYTIRQLTAQLDLSDPKAKSQVAQQIAPLIREVADPVERDHYWQELGRSLRIDDRTLRTLIGNRPKTTTKQPTAPTKSRPSQQLSRSNIAPRDPTRLELNYLRHLLQLPEVARRVDQQLARLQMPLVSKRDFSGALEQLVWQLLRQRAKVTPIVTVELFCQSADIPLRDYLLTLNTETCTNSDKLPAQLARSVLQWRKEKMSRDIKDVLGLKLQAQQLEDREGEEGHDSHLEQMRMMLAGINRALEEI